MLCGLAVALLLPIPLQAQEWLRYDPSLEADQPLSSALYGVSSYAELPSLLAPHSVPLRASELAASLQWLWADGDREFAKGVFDRPLPRALFRSELSTALGLSALLPGLPSRELAYAVLDEHHGNDALDQLLLFQDPFVGRFAARLLLPWASDTNAMIVALPGHDRDVYEFCVEFACEDYLRAGYGIAVLQLRADESGSLEHRVAAALLAEGFNLAGLHVYEAMQLTRFVRTLKQVDHNRVVVLGHSGGAVLGGFLAALDSRYRALARDTTAVFTEDMDGGLLCSTSAAIYRHHPQLEFLESLPAARLFEYGYPEGSEAVVGFFDEALAR